MPNARTRTLALVLAAAVAMGALSAPGVLAADEEDDDGPVVLTTPDMLDAAAARVASGEEPYATAWRHTKFSADLALTRTYEPYQGPQYLTYYRTARDQGRVARDLAIAAHVTGDDRYAERGRELLAQWSAAHAATYDYPTTYPSSDNPHGAGLVIGRTVTTWADAYALLYDRLDDDERAAVAEWFRALVDPILDSQAIWEKGSLACCPAPYLDRQFFNNHLGAQNMGLAAIGFALQDDDLIEFSLDSEDADDDRGQEGDEREAGELPDHNPRDLQTLIDGTIFMPGDFGSGEVGDVWRGNPGDPSLHGAPPPLPGETYDRYRVVQGHGIGYALFHLRLLTLTAEMARNNVDDDGTDFYAYVGPRGENLEISYDVYSDWFTTMDARAVNDGYYVDWIPDGIRDETVEEHLGDVALYELAHLRYPDNERITAALDSVDRAVFDRETFGWTAVLTHGAPTGP